jgi:hypothetical protein
MPKKITPHDAAKLKAFSLHFQGLQYHQIADDPQVKGRYTTHTLESYFSKGGMWNEEYIQWVEIQKDAINSQVTNMLTAQSITAMQTIMKIMLKKEAMDKDKMRAAENVLNRAGFMPVEKIKVETEAEHTPETIMSQLEELRRKEKEKQPA